MTGQGRTGWRNGSRWRPLLLAVPLLLALAAGGTGGLNAQQPQPTASATTDPGLSLSLAQHSLGNGQQEVDISYGAAQGVQVRLIEDQTALLLDALSTGVTATAVRQFPRGCGTGHRYDLYAIAGGAVVSSRSASIVLCAGETPAPTAAPQPLATAGAAATAAAAPAPPPVAMPAVPPAALTNPAAVRPGEPPVPPPPLEPPSLAMSRGFVLATPDDGAVASAVANGVPLLRLLAIWLRGTDSTDGGGGQYQYVQVANLGGGAQDLSGWSLQGDSGTISGLTYFFPDGFTLNPGDSCRIYVGHPAEATCTDGSFALYRFWVEHGTATLWDANRQLVDALAY